MIESKGYKITPIDGDLAVSRNAEIGRDVDIQGKARVAGSLKVEGFLDAPNIKGVVKGLFVTEEELKREYPNPRPGYCAIVLADGGKGFLYIAKNREWEKQSEEAQPFDFIVDSINVFASKGELADETARAQEAEHFLTQGIVNERTRAEAEENGIKQQAAKYDRIGFNKSADKIKLYAGSIDGSVHYADIPSATHENAGVMTAMDKTNLDNSTVKSFTWNNDTNPSDMDDFVVAGVYDIKGEHTREYDNLPIINTGGSYTFNARLTVLDSSISGSGEDDGKCITQVLSFSNRLGQGEVYIRTGKGSSLDNLTWEKWSTLQRNVNVGEVGSLDDLKENGIYSGVWKQGRINPNYLAFICIVINDYIIGIAPRRVSQFVYGLNKSDGSVVYQSRVWDDSKDKWGDWEILNQKEIASMISAEIKKVTDGIDPNKIDSLKDIITWIEEHGDVANILAAIKGLSDELGREADARMFADNTTRSMGVLFGGFSNRQTTAAEVVIGYKSIDQEHEGTFSIPAATNEKAGVMSAEDKEALSNISYTNIARDYGIQGELSKTYAKLPVEKRGIGVLFSDKSSEYGEAELQFNSISSSTVLKYTGPFKINIDDSDYTVPIVFGETGSDFFENLVQVMGARFDVALKNANTITIKKRSQGRIRIRTYENYIYEYTRYQVTFNIVDNHSGGNITIEMSGNTKQAKVEASDELPQVISKIMAGWSNAKISLEQISENAIVFTDFNSDFSKAESFNVNGGGIVTCSIDKLSTLKMNPVAVIVPRVTIKNGGDIRGISLYHQLVAGTSEELASNRDNFSLLLGDYDKQKIDMYRGIMPNEYEKNSIFPDLRGYSHIYSHRESGRNTIKQSFRRFVGTDPKSQWSNLKYWEEIGAYIQQLDFIRGYAEWTPIKDSYGNFIHGNRWVFKVLKPLEANIVKYAAGSSTSKSYKKFSIPIGEYVVDCENKDGSSLWWNNVTQTIEFGVPSSYVNCFLIALIYENYIHLKNIKKDSSFKGNLLIRQHIGTSLDVVYNYEACIGKTLDISDYLPDNFNGDWLEFLSNFFYAGEKWYFKEGEYKSKTFPMDYNYKSRKFKHKTITIIGDGVDKTIFRNWDFNTDTEKSETYANYFRGFYYKDFTLYNRGFGHYGGTNVDGREHETTFENVKLKFTKPVSGGYIVFALSNGFNLNIKNLVIEQEGCDMNTYAGVWIGGAVNLNVKGLKVGSQITKPFVAEGAANIYLNQVHTIGGQTGIFFGANKNRPLDGAIVENCIAEGATEECLSFDTYGNNVDKNPVIAELSIKNAVIEKVGNSSYYHNRLKVYCDARKIIGSHPNESYQAYSFSGDEEYLKQFYVYFSQLAGESFAGTVAKIIEVSEDENGQYLLLNTQLDPSKLTILEDTSINGSNNSNYQVASIVSGFFNITVKNNIVREGKHTGLALYQSIFNCLIDGNKIENCKNGSYIYAGRVLAKYVWNPVCGNIIVNNKFEGGDDKAFKFISYGSILSYNNIFSNNIILNSKGVSINKQRNLLYNANLVIGDESSIDINDVEALNFGTNTPTAPIIGQSFFNTTINKEQIWNGSEWI